jgi:hypothetical protein
VRIEKTTDVFLYDHCVIYQLLNRIQIVSACIIKYHQIDVIM